MQTIVFSILSIVATIAIVHASIRGVPDSKQHLYTNDPFTCLNTPEQTIPLARVNDDFCDCTDGSDEPGTSACPNGRFYCTNRMFRGLYIPSSRVNDGICDCCDGTDEYDTIVHCPNTCEQDGAEWRAQQAKLIQLAEEGAHKRAKYVAKAQQELGTTNAKIQDLEQQLAKADERIHEIQEQKDKAEEKERLERNKLQGSSRSTILHTTGLDQLNMDELHDVIIQFARESNSIPTLMDILKRRVSDQATAAGADPVVVSEAISWPEEESTAEEFELDEAKEKRQAFNEAHDHRNGLQSQLNTEKEKQTKDFGPDNAFYALDGKCIEKKIQKYTYSICPFGSAKQDHTSLGNFERFENNYKTMIFSNGQSCWNGPARSIRVLLKCGTYEEIITLDEPEKCTYVATMSTPAVCDAQFAEQVKLELHGDDAHSSIKTEL